MGGKLVNNYNKHLGGVVQIPVGKLAAQQWYERDPSLLAAEKAAMQHVFPNFQLDKLDDGRLCWIGEIKTGILGDNGWTVMAVYNYSHPKPVLGGSVRVYFVEPDINDLIAKLKKIPFPLLTDVDNNYYYLCLATPDEINTGNVVESAASAASYMCRVVQLLCCFELTMNGEISWDDYASSFNSLRKRNCKLILLPQDIQINK